MAIYGQKFEAILATLYVAIYGQKIKNRLFRNSNPRLPKIDQKLKSLKC